MLRKKVLKTIRQRELFQSGELVLVAVSGGPDSMALAHVLAALRSSLGHSVEIASVDHGLRSDARDEVALVERFARSLNVPFHGLQVEVGPGASLQANARDLRYGVL
ncbi:MAG: ATP-binding protein, partial [Myxococcota bacterium]